MDITRLNGQVLENAFYAVRKSRLHHYPHASIWHLCHHWKTLKPQILNELHLGTYQLSPTRAYCIEGQWFSVWEAQDAVVLKAIAMQLSKQIDIPHCHHLKGHGGIHGCIKALHQKKSKYQKVFKSDIDSYYASINHEILLNQLSVYTKCQKLMALFKQYMKRVEIKYGHYHSFEQGIPKPLMAAIYLSPLDKQLKDFGFYRRYMDDWIVLVKTRAQLRKVIKITHQVLKSLKLRMHPKKIFIGCIQKGFAFLGIQWNKQPEIAKQSIENHQFQLARRYAQDATQNSIGDYLKRWHSWCCSILNCCMDKPHHNNNLFPGNNYQGARDEKVYKSVGDIG